MRKRSAAKGKVPDPQAGSHTVSARISSGSFGVQCAAGASRSGVPSGPAGGSWASGRRVRCTVGTASPGRVVEAPGALAGAAPAYQVPLPGEDDTGDELFRLGTEPALEPEAAFRRAPAAGFLYETGDLRRTAGPCLRPGTALLPFVQFPSPGIPAKHRGLRATAPRPRLSRRAPRSHRTDPRRRSRATSCSHPQPTPLTHRKAHLHRRRPMHHRLPTCSPSGARTAS